MKKVSANCKFILLKYNSKTIFSHWFLILRWTLKNINFLLYNMIIKNLLVMFFLEKDRLKSIYLMTKQLIFNWNLWIYFDKIKILEYMDFFHTFNKDFFPITNTRLFKSLFRFKKGKFFKSKLWKISLFFRKKFVSLYRILVHKNDSFIIARNAYFEGLNFCYFDFFKLCWLILAGYKRKFFITAKNLKYLLSTTNILNLSKNFSETNRIKILSNLLSNGLKKIFFNPWLFRKLTKTWSLLTPINFWINSFTKLFYLDSSIPLTFIFYLEGFFWLDWQSIILLPSNTSFLPIYQYLLQFFLKRLQLSGFLLADFLSIEPLPSTLSSHGYNALNYNRFDQILWTLLVFFSWFQKFFQLPISFLYSEIFFLKKWFLPIHVRKQLSQLLNQAFSAWEISVTWYKSVEYGALVTTFFYRFISEVFNLIFNFSPSLIWIFPSKPWWLFFIYGLKKFNFFKWNWEYLGYFSKTFAIKSQVLAKIQISTSNRLKFRFGFFDFTFFYQRFKGKTFLNWKIQKSTNLKKFNFNISNYLARGHFPHGFFWNLVQWWFFYMKWLFKLWWFKKWWTMAEWKTIYDVFWMLQNRFWAGFFWWTGYYGWLLYYAFTFRTGLRSLWLDCNFSLGYSGNIVFWWYKILPFQFSSKTIVNFNNTEFSLAMLRNNTLFSSFSSYLTRFYLLEYILHLGHTNSTLELSFKDHLTLIYNERFILNILNIQINLKWNLNLIFKIFYLGGFVCLISPFNILLEALVTIYGAFTQQPYTRHVWINGLFSNFDKIFISIQWKIANCYAGQNVFTWVIVHWLVWLWFVLRGIFQNLTIDISFFPSLHWSSWVFLEACAKFYPTITISNTECFTPIFNLDYTIVSNDFSILSISFYINLLLVIFWRTKTTRKVEFSLYPQKLLAKALFYKILPLKNDGYYFNVIWHFKSLELLIWSAGNYLFAFTLGIRSTIFKYLLIYRRYLLNTIRQQNFWRFRYFWPTLKSLIL